MHAKYYVPVKVQALNDPAATCGNSRIAGLEKMLADGKLDDGTSPHVTIGCVPGTRKFTLH